MPHVGPGVRCRELGVPRYSDFRELLHLPPPSGFDTLTDDPALAAELREVYSDRLEDVDLIVGMFAEKRPRGFAFSDTASVILRHHPELRPALHRVENAFAPWRRSRP
ncbi:peroxidase family protein [Nonomuraea sp. CA-141351]|uniref:peroxidase family protein n=1 Tax=Nonomuraea sp. CA-141351 TaxID=3239996 RepID=UPI003D8F9825